MIISRVTVNGADARTLDTRQAKNQANLPWSRRCLRNLRICRITDGVA